MALKKASSAEPASWIVEWVQDFTESVGSLVPRGFEGYARVLHPAWRGGPNGHPVTWAKIAASNGRTVHPEAQWPHIAFTSEITDINQLQDPPEGALWDVAPEEGSLEREDARRLAGVLSRHTATADRCWFAVWEGWGDLRRDAYDAPSFELPARRYRLFEGPVEAAAESSGDSGFQSASLSWPDDRAWCVSTDVDLESTYVGATQLCIDEMVAHSSLEALRVRIGHGVQWASDTINESPLRLS